jgi:hypothetical protein
MGEKRGEEKENEMEAKFQMELDQSPIGWYSVSLSYCDVLHGSTENLMDAVQS